jgi:hypothetical protein
VTQTNLQWRQTVEFTPPDSGSDDDLPIPDAGMPEMSGLSCLPRLEAPAPCGRAPVFIAADFHRFLLAGCPDTQSPAEKPTATPAGAAVVLRSSRTEDARRYTGRGLAVSGTEVVAQAAASAQSLLQQGQESAAGILQSKAFAQLAQGMVKNHTEARTCLGRCLRSDVALVARVASSAPEVGLNALLRPA